MNKKLLLSMAVVGGVICSDVCLSEVESTNPAPLSTAEYQHNLMQKMKDEGVDSRLRSRKFSIKSRRLGANGAGVRKVFPVESK
ncbi:MAG: hypothetical protein LBL30_03965 [Holosporales bacterium]|nr:hypothetical protein [Holosporales bacterium]